MATSVHAHSADLERDCQNAWGCVQNTTSDRISSAEELRYALQCVGRNPTSSRVEQYWKQYAGRGGEGLGYEQFRVIIGREKPTSKDDLMRAFARLDRNGDGFITADELMQMMTKRGECMSEDEVKKIIADADQNGDGKLDYAEFCSMLLSTADESSRVCVSKSRSTPQLWKDGPSGAEKDSHAAKEEGTERMDPAPISNGQGEGPQSDEKKGDNDSTSLQSSSRRSIDLSQPKSSVEGQVEDTPVETSEPPAEGGTGNSSSKEEHATEREPICDPPPPPPESVQQPSAGSSADSNQGQLDKTEEGKKGIRKDTAEEEEVTWATSEVLLPTIEPSEESREHKPAGFHSSSEKSVHPPRGGMELSSKSTIELDKADVTDTLVKDKEIKSTPEKSREGPEEKRALDAKAPSSLASSSERSLKPPTSVFLPPLTSQSSSAVGQVDLGSLDYLLAKEKGSDGSKRRKGRRASADRSTAGRKGKPKEELAVARSEQNLIAAGNGCKMEGLSAQSMSSINRVQFEGLDALKGAQARGKEKEGLGAEEKGEPAAATETEDSPAPEQLQGKNKAPLSSGLSSSSVKVLPSMKQASPLSSQSDSRMGEGSSTPFIAVRTEDGAPQGEVGHSNEDTGVSGDGGKLPPPEQGDGAINQPPPPNPTETGSPAVTVSSALSPTSSNDSLPTVTDNSALLAASQGTEGGETGQDQPESSLPFGIVYHPPALTSPQGVKSWHAISARGCFYLSEDKGEDPVIKCHNYKLNLSSATTVWIEISRTSDVTLPVDVSLFVFKMDAEGHPTDLVTFTQHCIDQRWVCRVDLEKGTYALVPYTTGCQLKALEEGEGQGGVDLVRKDGSDIVLTEKCKAALEEIYHRIDLDGNGAISRTEFDFFQEAVNDEVCDDDSWQVVRENFDMTSDDEITLKGFYLLHTMTAADSEGGEEELRSILTAMGYDRDLRLRQGCPFLMDIYSEQCEAELEIVDVLQCSDTVDPALSKLGVAKGVSGELKGCDDSSVMGHAYTLPHWAMIVVENKNKHSVNVQVDCSRSENYSTNRDSSVHVLTIEGGSAKLVYHLTKEKEDVEWQPHCIISLLKQ